MIECNCAIVMYLCLIVNVIMLYYCEFSEEKGCGLVTASPGIVLQGRLMPESCPLLQAPDIQDCT